MINDLDLLISRAIVVRCSIQEQWLRVAATRHLLRQCPHDGDYVDMLLDALVIDHTDDNVDTALGMAAHGILHLDECFDILGLLEQDGSPEHPLDILAKMADE